MHRRLPLTLAVYSIALLLVGTLTGCATAPGSTDQEPTTTDFQGVVRNAVGGAPIENATVTLTPNVTAAARAPMTDTTDSQGRYQFEELPEGSYSVEVTPPTGQSFVAMRAQTVKVGGEGGTENATLPLITTDDLQGAQVRITPAEAEVEAGGTQRFTVILLREDGTEIQAFYPFWALSRPVGKLKVNDDGTCLYTAPAADAASVREHGYDLQIAASVGDQSDASSYLFGTANIRLLGGTTDDDGEHDDGDAADRDEWVVFESGEVGARDIHGLPPDAASLHEAEELVATDADEHLPTGIPGTSAFYYVVGERVVRVHDAAGDEDEAIHDVPSGATIVDLAISADGAFLAIAYERADGTHGVDVHDGMDLAYQSDDLEDVRTPLGHRPFSEGEEYFAYCWNDLSGAATEGAAAGGTENILSIVSLDSEEPNFVYADRQVWRPTLRVGDEFGGIMNVGGHIKYARIYLPDDEVTDECEGDWVVEYIVFKGFEWTQRGTVAWSADGEHLALWPKAGADDGQARIFEVDEVLGGTWSGGVEHDGCADVAWAEESDKWAGLGGRDLLIGTGADDTDPDAVVEAAAPGTSPPTWMLEPAGDGGCDDDCED